MKPKAKAKPAKTIPANEKSVETLNQGKILYKRTSQMLIAIILLNCNHRLPKNIN